LRVRDTIIPLRNDYQSRRLRRIVVCLPGVPVIAIVLEYAGRAAQYRWLLSVSLTSTTGAELESCAVNATGDGRNSRRMQSVDL
jgi:hypothetical protein